MTNTTISQKLDTTKNKFDTSYMITTRKILTKKSTTGDLKAYHQLEKSTMKIEVTTFNHKDYRPNPKVVISKVDSITCTRSWLGLLMTVDLPTIKFF